MATMKDWMLTLVKPQKLAFAKPWRCLLSVNFLSTLERSQRDFRERPGREHATDDAGGLLSVYRAAFCCYLVLFLTTYH